MKKLIVLVCLGMVLFSSSGTVLHAQYSTNQKIEAEDLYDSRVVCADGNDWLRVSHGEGWVDHPSNFLYSQCGNRHWLCDSRVTNFNGRCMFSCADVYVSADIEIPETGTYVIYAYVASWSDSATIMGNEGCNRTDKWECCGWFIAWDDPSKLDKFQGAWTGGPSDFEMNVDYQYWWATYPHNTFCGQFDLDTVWVGHKRGECPNEDPRECDFPRAEYFLTRGTHTIYLKTGDEYTLIDWLLVAKADDPPPTAEPGRPWSGTSVDESSRQRPTAYALEQNFPNPFNSETTILYYLPVRAQVSLSVYDLIGRKVTDLVKETQSPGLHNVTFDAKGLPSGTYFYRIAITCTSCQGKGKTLFTEQKAMQYLK